MKLRDIDGMGWFMFAMGTLLVLGFAAYIAGECLDGLDQRACRNRGGMVDSHGYGQWRCIGGSR